MSLPQGIGSGELLEGGFSLKNPKFVFRIAVRVSLGDVLTLNPSFRFPIKENSSLAGKENL